MTSKQPDFDDINALALEACDMWQEHLSAFASDPDARAELTRYLEPQRRLFADWAALVQKGAQNGTMQKEASHESGHQAQPAQPADSRPAAAQPTVQPAPEPEPPPQAPPRGAANGDDPLRTAQLALRVAELEKRLGQLERHFAASDKQSAGAPRRTQRETP